MTATTQAGPNASLHWLRDQSRRLVAAARFIGGTGHVLYYPVANGIAYPWFYLRDFVYMYESAPELFPPEEVRPVLDLIVANIRSDGWMPERITSEGKPIYRCHGENDVIDSGPFFIKLVKAYVESTGDDGFIGQHFEKLCRALEVLPVEEESGLIWIDPGHPGTAYGFTDQIAKTGREFFCSLMMLESWEILAGWAVRLSDEKRQIWCRDGISKIRRNLSLLWDDESGMFFAASRDCRQIDIWGSIYACQVKAVTGGQRDRIVHWLMANRQRSEYLCHLRHLPADEVWDRIISPFERDHVKGHFQNGAYWSTPSGWLAELLESASRGAGVAYLDELVRAFQDIGIWECIGPDGYRQNRDNLSSVLLPYASCRRICAARACSP